MSHGQHQAVDTNNNITVRTGCRRPQSLEGNRSRAGQCNPLPTHVVVKICSARGGPSAGGPPARAPSAPWLIRHCLGSTRFAGAEAILLWYKDMFDNGRQAVQYQALVQFVEVTRKVNWSEAFRWSFPGFRRATTRACLQSIGKRCVLAHAWGRLSTHCVVTRPIEGL